MGKCVFCGGELRHDDNTTYTETIDLTEAEGRIIHVVIFGVPAAVCHRCGEKEFSGDVADKLFGFVKAAKNEAAAKLVKGRLIYTYKGKFEELSASGPSSPKRRTK